MASAFFDEDSLSSWLWSNCRTFFKFLVRWSLDLDPARKATSLDFWLRNNEVSRSAALRNSGCALNRILTLSDSAFVVSNWFHRLRKACLSNDGNCLLCSVLLYLYCQENIHARAKLKKYLSSARIHDSSKLKSFLN